jgi:hypothetical protein
MKEKFKKFKESNPDVKFLGRTPKISEWKLGLVTCEIASVVDSDGNVWWTVSSNVNTEDYRAGQRPQWHDKFRCLLNPPVSDGLLKAICAEWLEIS